MDQRRMRARVMMSWWDLGDPVIVTRGGVKLGAIVVRKPSYHDNAPLWVTSDDGEVIQITTDDLASGALDITMELPRTTRPTPVLTWFAGVECTTRRTVHGLRLPMCSTGTGAAALRDPYAQETHDIHASTLRPIAPERRPRRATYRPATKDLPGTSRIWEREFGGKLYRFHMAIMRSGELRSHVQVYNGDPRGRDTWYAWDCVRVSRRRAPRDRPGCPTCDAQHDVVGTCIVCRNLIYRDCAGDLLHVDDADVFTSREGDHAARLRELPPAAPRFQTA